MTSDSDIEAMVDRVIAEVFQGEFATRNVATKYPTLIHGVEVISRAHGNRAVIIKAGHAWVTGFIPHLNIGAEMVDEDDDLIYKEEELRKLCRALRLYLGGGGHLVQRRRLFGRGTTTELELEIDGFVWRFGKRSCTWARSA